MNGSLSLGRMGGVAVKLHWSWFGFFALVVLSLGISYPRTFPGVDGAWAWGAAVVSAGLFLVSVLGHELAHAWMAQARHVPVRGITLFLLGGAAEIEQDAERPMDEFVITVVGPLSSALFALGFGGLAWLGHGVPVVYAIAATLALVNASLALFNLIPGFPLDGGRMLRALLWGVTHDFVRATRWASRLGQLIGAGLTLLGLAQTFLLGEGLGGLWTAGIGWYLSNIAGASYRQGVLLGALGRRQVAEMMRPHFAWVYGGTRLADVVGHYFAHTPSPGLPVLREGCLTGMITYTQVRTLDRAQWPLTPVESVMTPLDRLATIAPSASAAQLLRLMQGRQVAEVPVLDNGQLVGLVTQEDLLRVVNRQPGA